MNYPNSLIPSPIDHNDIMSSTIAPLIVRYPEEVPSPFDLTILDQGNTPHCVGFSLAAIRQYEALRQRVIRTFDGDWIYNQAKLIDGDPTLQGTYLRAGLKVLQKTGAKPINALDYQDFRVGAYAQVDELTFEGLKKDIFVYGAVLAGFTGSNNGWSNSILKPPAAGEATWGHATALVGYTKDYLILQNSWGEDAGQNGIFFVPSNYLPFEAWVVSTDLPIVPTREIGWVASKYILDGFTTIPLNLRSSAGLQGKVIVVLPKGTSVSLVDSEAVTADGYTWVNVLVN